MSAEGIVFRAIPAMHGRKEAIRAGLQGHMKVRRHAIICGKKFYEISGDVHGFDGTNTQAFEGSFVKNTAQQLREGNARAEISSVGSNIDAAKNDLLHT